jgi:hypothetical protein
MNIQEGASDFAETKADGVSRLGIKPRKVLYQGRKLSLFLFSLFTTKPVFSDPGVSFGGLSG